MGAFSETKIFLGISARKVGQFLKLQWHLPALIVGEHLWQVAYSRLSVFLYRHSTLQKLPRTPVIRKCD